MNIHKNARLTYVRRVELVQWITQHRLSPADAAIRAGVSEPTVYKWLGRFLTEGEAGLHDRSSRPHHSPGQIAEQLALAIVQLRRKRLTQARIAQALQVSKSTVSRICQRAGLARLASLEPTEPTQRYEHAQPGDMLHIDIKKLARIEAVGHRITGNPRDHSRGAGWECLFVAIDDHSRVAFTQMYPDETKHSAQTFLQAATAYYASLGIKVRRLLTDNGPAFRAKSYAALCAELGIKHRFTRAYRPQTNGKAERFIQSALREWAYGFVYPHSDQRREMLDHWNHHYNYHRPHQGIAGAVPVSRLNNVLTLNT